MIDTHSHINMIEGLTLDEIIENAKADGVNKIIVPSAYPSDIDTVYEIAQNMIMFTDYWGFIHQRLKTGMTI